MRSAPSGDFFVYGLRVRSELRLPELLPATGQNPPQVIIRLGTMPDHPDSTPGVHAMDGGVLLVVQGVAQFWIKNGTEIVVEPNSGVPVKNVRLFLLGSAMGVLLHQRGLLPLHANAVKIGDKAFAFMGQSGSGKSTLAAWFHHHGFRVIADDVCVVRFDADERPLVAPGLPRLRLWKDALEKTGRQCSQFSRSYAGDEAADKFDVPLPRITAVRSDVELAGVYVLEKGDSFSIRPMRGLDAGEALFANTYRGNYLPAAGEVQTHWRTCIRLARQTPLFQLTRAWESSAILGHVEQLVEHATQLTADYAGGQWQSSV